MNVGLVIKQFVSYFVEPFGLMSFLFVVGIYFLYRDKNTKAKIFLSLSVFFLILFSSPIFSNFLIKNLENKYAKYDYKYDVKYIHVLGNGHNIDTKQPLSSHLSDAGTKRVLEGVLIYKHTKNAKIIFTGYAGDTNVSNARMNSKLAIALGVDKKDIILGEKPVDTKEEAMFCKTIVQNEPVALVTSATHLPRAMRLFKNQGLHPIAAPTDFKRVKYVSYLKLPSVNAMLKSQIAMHEYIGMLWTKIRE